MMLFSSPCVFETSHQDASEPKDSTFHSAFVCFKLLRVDQFPASAQSIYTIKRFFFLFFIRVNTGSRLWKALWKSSVRPRRGCSGHACPRAAEDPGSSESGSRGPSSLRPGSLQHRTAGAPPTFFPKTCSSRRPQILPHPPLRTNVHRSFL